MTQPTFVPTNIMTTEPDDTAMKATPSSTSQPVVDGPSLVPGWALTVLKRDLPPDVDVINAVTLEKGRFKGAVLANTTRGCALVTKSTLGEPRLVELPFPWKIVSFSCRRCGETNDAHDPQLPRAIHCASCGQRYPVDAAGNVEGALPVPGTSPKPNPTRPPLPTPRKPMAARPPMGGVGGQ